MAKEVSTHLHEEMRAALVEDPKVKRLFMFEQCGGIGELRHALAQADADTLKAWEYLHAGKHAN